MIAREDRRYLVDSAALSDARNPMRFTASINRSTLRSLSIGMRQSVVEFSE